MFGNMGNSSFAFLNSIASSFNDPAARASAYNPLPQNQVQNTYSPVNYTKPVTTYVPGPQITSQVTYQQILQLIPVQLLV